MPLPRSLRVNAGSWRRQEALAALAEVHARRAGSPPPSPTLLKALEGLLLTAASSESHHARYCAMVWAGKTFSSDHVVSRCAGTHERHGCRRAAAAPPPRRCRVRLPAAA